MTSYYVWNGQIYYGAKALAEDAGVSVRRVYRHLDAHGDLYELTGKVLHWGGRKFTSVAAVAEAAGVSRHTVYWHLREHGSLERLGAGRWQAKSPATATKAAKSKGVASADENRGTYGTSASARKVSADDIDAAIDQAFRVVLSRRGGRA